MTDLGDSALASVRAHLLVHTGNDQDGSAGGSPHQNQDDGQCVDHDRQPRRTVVRYKSATSIIVPRLPSGVSLRLSYSVILMKPSWTSCVVRAMASVLTRMAG